MWRSTFRLLSNTSNSASLSRQYCGLDREMLTRRLRVCVLDIFHREWKEFLRNFSVCFFLVFFSFFFRACSPSAYFKNFIFYTWGQVGKKRNFVKKWASSTAQENKKLSGERDESEGDADAESPVKPRPHSGFFPSIFPSLFSLPLSRQPGREAAYCDHSLFSIELWDSQYMTTFAFESGI